MWENVQLRERNREPVVKYYGKWPFLRVYGTQEFLSTVFSLANMLPHIYYLYALPKQVDAKNYMRFPMKIFSLVGINTWLWSTVFHARDVLITERLDYFSASFGIMFHIAVSICRLFHLRSIRHQLYCFIPCVVLFLVHVSYLQFVHFDYGWNMMVIYFISDFSNR